MTSRARSLYERLAARRALQPLPLLVILAAIILLLSICIRLPAMEAVDRAVTHLVQGLRTPAMDRAAIAITRMGSTNMLIAVAAASAVVLIASRRAVEALLMLLTLAALPLDVLLKQLVDRPRPAAPFVTIILPALGLSFPSGHAMGSATVYGFLAYIAWTIIANRRARNAAVASFVALAFAIGISRVYLGVHWFSDVLAGWMAGAFCLVVLALLYRPVALARRQGKDADGPA